MAIIVIDSYSETNQNTNYTMYNGAAIGISHSFTGVAGTLVGCKWVCDKYGSPTGNIVAKLYAHTGNFGISSKPTGAVLATSDNVDVATLLSYPNLMVITFTFSGVNQHTLESETYYCLTIEYSGGDVSNHVRVYCDSDAPTHSGNDALTWNGSTWITYDHDACFYVYADAVIPPSHDILSIAKPITLKTTKEINSAWTANMQIIPDDYIASEGYTDIENEEYIVKHLKKIKSGGKYYYDISLYHNGIAELTDITIDRFCLTDTVSNLLTTILAPTAWTAGTVDITEIILLKTDKRTTVLEALNILAEKCGGELNFNSKARTVDLKRQIGTETKLQLRYDKNCTHIEKEEDSTDLVTRIYPYGPDNWTINTTTLSNCEDEAEWAPSGGASVAASTAIKMQGSQGVEITAAALNETFINDLGAGGVIDLSDHDSLKFWIYSSVDNADGFTFGIGEAAYTDNTITTGALTADCWKEITYDISGIANASKNAIRYIGFKNLTNGAAVAVIDMIRAFSGNIYIDSGNIGSYRINKEYVYNHSAKPEKIQFEKILYPTEDAYESLANPNTNYGSATVLKALNGGNPGQPADDRRSVMKFDLSDIPSDVTIVSATLNMYFNKIGSALSQTSMKIATSDWAESTDTWNTHPTVSDTIYVWDTSGSADWKDDGGAMTATVQNWLDGVLDNYGVAFERPDSDCDEIEWDSREGINKPYLTIIYTITTDPSPVIISAAMDYLANHDEPKLLYKVKVADLSKVMVDTWEDEEINLGDTVRLYDSELDLNVDVRVKKITRNILDPSDIDLELTNKAYNIADIEAKRAKQLSYAMPYKDNDKIIDANAIQQGYFGSDVNV